MAKEHDSSSYDNMYQTGGCQGVYNLPYFRSWYYPLFKQVARELLQHKAKKILEVGCGNGTLASMLLTKYDFDYKGFDFSRIGVEKAIATNGRKECFFMADARDPSSYNLTYDTIICTEVLEHIEEDRKVIQNWNPGTVCICSVPNFDSSTHVRFFQSEEDVRNRYADLIDIALIQRIKKPILADLGWRNYLRYIRWNRYRPQRLLELFGYGDFTTIGGWFLFVGKKR
jgi:2-polyprenyl-3-methyl-5-hydroxy-6-metoxy-1,4-benzoquinol methylase